MAGWKVWKCKCNYIFDEKREFKKADYIDPIKDAKNFECPHCGRPAKYLEEIEED